MISLKEASAYLETALFGVFYYQLITIFRIFGFLQHQMVSHLSQKDQLQDLGIIHAAPRFPQGAETKIIAAIIDEDLRVHNIFRIELSSRNGLSTGNTGGYIADVGIVGSARLQDALILAVDALARCGDGKRKLGFLIRFSLKDYTVKWVTPYNTASAKFAVVGDTIYSSDGGSCENDYLYAIDVKTGRVVARDFVPTAFNWVFAENGRLFGQTYGGGFVYRLK
ncbi:MAG: hypothetical protein SD837_04565 [Candidatus Electrothrix scaldis]|nr:MAG: hypothetical protein SD837_04565 [Candidatus Electrothrix sp. GW3-3]